MSSPAIKAGALMVALLVVGCANDPPAVPPVELAAFDQQVTFARRWTASTGDAGRGRFEPLVSSERVVVADARGEITAFDRQNGMRLWQADLDTRLASAVGGDESAVYVGTTDGVVHALNATDGKPLWLAESSSEILVPPVTGFGVVLVRSVDGRVVALEPNDGSERWSVSQTPPALTVTGYSRPLLVDGGALVGFDDGRLLALSLTNGRTIWESVLSVPSGRSEVERLVDVDADPRTDDSGIYVVNYQGRAARLEPGRGQVVWSVPMSSTSGLDLAGESVVVVDDEDGVHGLDAATGRTLWSSEALRGRRLSPPAMLGDGSAFVVGDLEGYAHVLSMDDGALIGRVRVSKAPVTARPQVDGDSVVVLASDGDVAAYEVAR